jgi:hypothetical protein
MGNYIKTGKKPGRPKQLRPNDINSEWEDKPGQLRFARLKRLMALTETKQDNVLLNTVMPEQIEKPSYTTVYGLDIDKKWKEIGYKCLHCGKAFSKLVKMIEHPLICEKTLKINSNTEDEFMPIQAVTVKGERYYRWGTGGKLYKNRTDAESVARAAYASGYQESTVHKGRPQNSPKVNK